VRQLLRDAADKVGGTTLKAVDYMDDGTPIHLTVEIDKELGNARFDFTGTGPQIYGNLNAPVSVVHSAIIYWYALRLFPVQSSLVACAQWSARTFR
jgi:5-oxoprolinase (ATP-hydrolysing)